MRETQAIIDAYRRARAEGVRAALATVVRVEGSAYRRPSVRMFITEKGETTGVLSGGCLERDVCERAAQVMRTGEALVVRYDSTSKDDIVFGLGMGCNGVVEILIEPVNDDATEDLLRFLAECSAGQRSGALATVILREGETEITIGTRAFLYPSGASESDATISGVVISGNIFHDLRDAVQIGQSSIKSYEVDAGKVEVFVEIVEPPVPLVIFGAGDDAFPLVGFARNLGWHTTVVDTRARSTSTERFAEADSVLLCRPEAVGACVPLLEQSAVVLMTHNYLHDLELLKTLINRRVRYLGCLGPRRRAERLLLELASGSVASAAAYIGQLHAPAGLDIGAETPLEIALSIVAEIRAVLTGREGGLLRHRNGSIHNKVTDASRDVAWPVSVGSPTRSSQVAMSRAS
jgi:xanthine/CO dehydrogenase XdhC/CoxF family maturation factor